MPFEALGLDPKIAKAVREAGYTEPTPIQTKAIPLVLRGSRRHRNRADRHRQDRRVRAADSAAPFHARLGHEPPLHARASSSPRRASWSCRSKRTCASTRAISISASPPFTAASASGRRSRPSAPEPKSSSPRPAASSISWIRATSTSPASKWPCSTKPTACWTWASSPPCAASSKRCRNSGRR